MKHVLEVKELTQQFKTRKQGKIKKITAVDHVSFSLNEGEILGIVGESGCGKSTLAKALMGFGINTTGSVMVDDIEMVASKSRDKRKAYQFIQMVFQDPIGSFNPRKRLGYGIGESLKNQGMSRKKINKRICVLLEKCGLPAEFANRYPFEVSGGQAQRVAIARALAVEPKIIVCDEATSALDMTIQQQIMELLLKLKEERHVAIIFICHNLALVQSFCDRVLVMKDGKIVEEGTAKEVIQNPREEYTKRLVEAARNH